jgi:hypothetical protein
MSRFRLVGLAAAVMALSTLALADVPGAAPAPFGAGGSTTTRGSSAAPASPPKGPMSASEARRVYNQAVDVLKRPPSSRPSNNLPPRVPTGALIDTITLSAVQPVVNGRARLSLSTWEGGANVPTYLHAATWDTEANVISFHTIANGQWSKDNTVQGAESELAINVMRDVGRVYIASCTLTAPIGECSAQASAEGWSKTYTVPHDAQGMVFWVLPVRQRDTTPALTKASLFPVGGGANWLISKCELTTYAAPN